MGLVHWGPPPQLLTQLRDALGLDTFVETGTYRGDTALWAAGFFAHVITIEASAEVFEFASARLRERANVNALHGDTRTVLPQVLSELSATPARRAALWLDAHFCVGGPTYGHAEGECPLLQELAAIAQARGHDAQPHVILIDDARLFLAPPPLPHRADQWPAIEPVLAGIRAAAPQHFITIFEDVIIAVPPAARELLVRYCQQRAK
jgi:hypothetical protein